VKINGVDIKTPTKFNVEKYPLVAKSGRVASGRMTADMIGWWRKFNLEYAVINGDELNVILGLIINGSDFFLDFTYAENGVNKTARCYPGAINSDLFRSDIWIWTNVKFALIEQ
jgi:hypothetical protein